MFHLSHQRSSVKVRLFAIFFGLLMLSLIIFVVTRGRSTPTPNTQQSYVGPIVQESPDRSAIANQKLYVDPNNYAALAVSRAPVQQRDQLARLSSQPIAEWFGDWNRAVSQDVAQYVGAARVAQALPMIVLYNIPLRDCGQHSLGGAGSHTAYRQWVDQVVAGIQNNEALIIIEPDALPQLHCLSSEQQLNDRLASLSYAVTSLKALPATRVYIDAGNAGWKKPAEIAQSLRQPGLIKADGISVNVGNYYSDDASLAYGQEIVRLVEGKRIIIDSSRNGNGSARVEAWCNPPGRSLGVTPTTDVSKLGLDAYLWIKKPGTSDGRCNGGPKAGEWWLENALQLTSTKP